jgi:8-oxo-dGTP pyrophosphatase MutT (NUDIX family)
MNPIPDFAYGVIPVFKQEHDFLFLIVQHAPGHWSFPKGHKEGSETDIESATRELWEETGITECDIREDIQFHATHTFEQKGVVYQKTNTYFLGFVTDTTVSIPEEWKHEIIDAKFCTYDEAKKLINFAPIIKTLDEVRDFLNIDQTSN